MADVPRQQVNDDPAPTPRRWLIINAVISSAVALLVAWLIVR